MSCRGCRFWQPKKKNAKTFLRQKQTTKAAKIFFLETPRPSYRGQRKLSIYEKNFTGQQLGSRPMVASSIRGVRGFKNQNVIFILGVHRRNTKIWTIFC